MSPLITIIEEKEKEFDEKFTVWNSKYSWAEKHKIEERYTPQDTKKFFLSVLISILEADIEEINKNLRKYHEQTYFEDSVFNDAIRGMAIRGIISSKQHLLEELKKKV